MKPALILAALSTMLATPALAESECRSPDLVTATIARDHPGDVVKMYAGDDAKKIATGIAVMIGEAVTPGDGFLVSYLKDSPIAYVVRSENNCASRHGRFPAAALRTWLGTVS